MKKALLQFADFTERTARASAQGLVPLINLCDRILFPQEKSTLGSLAIEHFNLRPTSLARVESRFSR